jgi:hypothetical protein
MKPTVGRIIHYYHPCWPNEPLAAVVTSALPLAHDRETSSVFDIDAEENQYAVKFQLLLSTDQREELGMDANREWSWFSKDSQPYYWTWPVKS